MEESSEFSCSLSPDDLRDRGIAWKRLEAVLIDRLRTDGGFRVRYRGAPGVSDSLRALVALERDCCGWASWSVSDTDGYAVLDVTGPHDKVVRLAAAFGVPTLAPPVKEEAS